MKTVKRSFAPCLFGGLFALSLAACANYDGEEIIIDEPIDETADELAAVNMNDSATSVKRAKNAKSLSSAAGECGAKEVAVTFEGETACQKLTPENLEEAQACTGDGKSFAECLGGDEIQRLCGEYSCGNTTCDCYSGLFGGCGACMKLMEETA